MMKLMPKSLVHMWLIRKTSLSCCQILCPFKIQPFWNVFGLPAIGGLITCKVPFPPLLMLILKTELSFHIMVLRSMHGWVNQFTTKPKFFFIQKNGQILEITTSLHQRFYIDFLHIFSMLLMAHLKFFFFKHLSKKIIKYFVFQYNMDL